MKFSEIQKLTAETLDEFHKLGWLEYYDDTKEIFRLTDLGQKALKWRQEHE